MQTSFSDIVNNVRNLSMTEKLEIKNIVEKSIIEEQREEIRVSYIKSKEEYKENKLTFSNDIKVLQKNID